jgi:uncharacterized protein involved in exopolysaccharide biosynthesis
VSKQDYPVNNQTSVMDQETTAAALAEDDGLGMIDLLLILAARKKTIVAITVLCTAIAAAVAFLLPNVYTATAVIMPRNSRKPPSPACWASWDRWPPWPAKISD